MEAVNDRLDWLVSSNSNVFFNNERDKQVKQKGDNMKNTNPVWYIVISLTIWCVWNSVGSNKVVSTLNDIRTEQKVVLQEVAHLMDRLQTLENIEPEVIVKEIIKEVEVPSEAKDVLDVLKEGG